MRTHLPACVQVLFSGGRFQWKRLQNLIRLAKEGSSGLDLSDTVATGARVVLLDERLRSQLLLALTEDNRLHIDVRTPFSGPSPQPQCLGMVERVEAVTEGMHYQHFLHSLWALLCPSRISGHVFATRSSRLGHLGWFKQCRQLLTT